MKPIETAYNGYRFRSRLEARWAVFFDMLGIAYEYEKEGYHVGSMWYLPDFWLPQQDCWIEIKGQKPNEQERHRAEALAKFTKKDVYLFSGPIPLPDSSFNEKGPMGCYEYGDGAEVFFWSDEVAGEVASDHPYWWCECPVCGVLDICFCGWSERLSCHHSKRKAPNYGSSRLIGAYTAARSARFERYV